MNTVVASVAGGVIPPFFPSSVLEGRLFDPARLVRSFKGIVPGISLALLSINAYPSLGRFIQGNYGGSTDDPLSDGLFLGGTLSGALAAFPQTNRFKGIRLAMIGQVFNLAALGYEMIRHRDDLGEAPVARIAIQAATLLILSQTALDEIGKLNPPNRLFPPASVLWPTRPPPGSRTNQEIFDAVIAKYHQKKPNAMRPFHFVDEILQEEGLMVRDEWVGSRLVRIIDMRGIKVKDLDLKSVNFSCGSYLPAEQRGSVFLDFSGSVFENFKLENGYFRNCLFDDAKLLNIHWKTVPIDYCQFSGKTRITGTIEAGEHGGHIGTSLFDDVQLDEVTFKNITFRRSVIQGSTFNRCTFDGVAFEGEVVDNFHHIRNSRFDRCRFSTATFEKVSVSKSSFSGSQFHRCQIKFSRWFSADFSSHPKMEADWQTVFTESYIGLDAHFTRSSFRNVHMSGTHITSALPHNSAGRSMSVIFDECDFSGFWFVNTPASVKAGWKAQIYGTEFRRSNFQKAVFDPTVQFGEANAPLTFEVCDFTGARFSAKQGGRFTGPTFLRDRVIWNGWNIFEEVHWEGVRLADHARGNYGIVIEGNFTKAHLNGGDLYAADFGHSLFERIDLSGARCEKTALKRCRNLYSARVDPLTDMKQALLPRLMTDSPIKRLGQQQGAHFV